MQFELTEEQQKLREAARRFAEKEIAPFSGQWDDLGQYPRHILRKAAEQGLTALLCPKECGGLDLGYLTSAIILEELARGCFATTFSLVVHNNFANSVCRRGTPDQRERFGLPMVRGEKLGAFAMTEPDAGSDAAAIRTTAVLDGDYYVINGTKVFVSNAGEADIYNVILKTSPEKGTGGFAMILVEKGTPGLKIGKPDRKMGANALPTSEVVFEECRVPKENLFIPEGQGFKAALFAIDLARMYVGAMASGLSQIALDTAIAYAKERKQFGQPIANFQGLQWIFADLATEIDAGRLLSYRAGYLMDQGKPASKEAAMAKLYAADLSVKVTAKCAEILGAYGYLKDYHLERYIRFARVTQIIDGTSQIQKVVIARNLLK